MSKMRGPQVSEESRGNVDTGTGRMATNAGLNTLPTFLYKTGMMGELVSILAH